MSHHIKLSDIIAGTGAMLIAILYITPNAAWDGAHVLTIVAALAGLGSGWYIARERHWIMKIFLYAGMMVLCILIAGLLHQAITHTL